MGSAGGEVLKLREEDVCKLLFCQSHLGSANVDFQMEQYMYARRPDGQFIINVKKTMEKLQLAARAIVAVETPSDVIILSARPYAQRGLLKFAAHTGATAIAGRFTPGTFTNQIQRAFKEPRLLIVSDPRIDHQAVTEASYVGIPVIAFANSDSPLKLVDIAIPCNNKGKNSIGLMLWLLAREVMVMRGVINRATGFIYEGKEIMPDLYMYRDPEEDAKEEGGPEGEGAPMVEQPWGQEVGGAAQPVATMDATDAFATAPVVGEEAGGAAAPAAAAAGGAFVVDVSAQPIDWAAEVEGGQPATAAAAAPAQPAQQWGGGGADWGGSAGQNW